MRTRALRLFVLGWALVATAGCASLPPPPDKPVSHALPAHQTTPLGRLAQAQAPVAGMSGFRLLVSGEEAFATLSALADRAEKTLDLQYYLIRSDASAYALMQRVRAAADRGVRVRLLLDDLNTSGQDDGLLALTHHPHIDVRLFNPFPSGRFSTVSRLLGSLTDFDRINSRMHNKMFVADNALAVTGGRNVGDTYFLRNPDSNFLDVDLIVAGPNVRALSRIFDRFWNHPLAYPVAALVDSPPNEMGVPAGLGPSAPVAPTSGLGAKGVVQLARDSAMPVGPSPSDRAPAPAHQFPHELAQGQLRLIWAPSAVLADRPSKLELEGEPVVAPTPDAVASVDRLMGSARKELVLITPYLVPGPSQMAMFRALRRQGVQVRILTNSLATTDAPAVHVGYVRHREALLREGIELYELRTRIKEQRRSRLGAFGSSLASLHAKVLVVDGRTSLVGSMNLDPRSAKLNSEMGLVVSSPTLASQLLQLYQDVRSNSYEVSLDDRGRLRGRYQDGDRLTELHSEPDASLWLKLSLKLMAPFAPDELL